jgi:hypothetical protein
LSLNAIKRAPTAIGLAAVIWFLPVIAIITPGTLSVDVKSGHVVHSREFGIDGPAVLDNKTFSLSDGGNVRNTMPSQHVEKVARRVMDGAM